MLAERHSGFLGARRAGYAPGRRTLSSIYDISALEKLTQRASFNGRPHSRRLPKLCLVAMRPELAEAIMWMRCRHWKIMVEGGGRQMVEMPHYV